MKNSRKGLPQMGQPILSGLPIFLLGGENEIVIRWSGLISCIDGVY